MSFSRKLRIEDLLSLPREENKNNIHNNCNQIPKNQKDFGHKKRIKP